jgi:hypothetical protein
MNPFDFVKSIITSKIDLIDENPEEQPDYIPFLTNKALSYFPDSIFHAQAMNQNVHLDKKMQYDYLRNSLPKRDRFSRWTKPEKNELIEAVKLLYHYNDVKAIQAIKCLSDEQKRNILEMYNQVSENSPEDKDQNKDK